MTRVARRRFGIPLLTTVLAVWTGALEAEAQTLEGRLFDTTSGRPVDGALVRLLDDAGAVRGSALSDSLGVFTVQTSEAGSYRLEAQRIGYLLREEVVVLVAGEPRRIELGLEPTVVLLDPFVVTGAPELRPAECTQQLVSGRVIDHATGDGIPGAAVELIGRRGSPLVTVESDAEGRFAFLVPGAGMYQLRGESPGYEAAAGGELPIIPGDTVAVDFLLAADAVLPAPMVVTASARPWNDRSALLRREAFFRRLAGCQLSSPIGSRFGEFIDRSVIAEWEGEDWSVGHMLEAEARGVWDYAPTGELTLFGGCTPLVFGDGIALLAPAGSADLPPDFLVFYTPETLEAVEVHRYPHVPRDYWLQGQSPCGVVALWSRVPEGEDPPGTRWNTVFGFGSVLLVLYLLM